MRSRLIAVVALVATLGVPSSARAAIIGIGDQKRDLFADPRFRDLGIRHVRLNVSWDALRYQWQVDHIDRWMAAARQAGAQPLVIFNRSRLPQYRKALPGVQDFVAEFRNFRARYPWVLDFATWNEANFCAQPTCHEPRVVAAYYSALRRECPQCRILGAALLGTGGMVRWVRKFQAAAQPAPRYWGLHNYDDVNRFHRQWTRALLRATKGEVWLTETGGFVAYRTRFDLGFRPSPRRAAVALRWLFDWMLPLSRRITRVYLYQWNARVRGEWWDTGLIGPDRRSRPAFKVLKRVIAKGVRRRPPGDASARRRWVDRHLRRY